MKKGVILLSFLILSIVIFSGYVFAQETDAAGVVLNENATTISEEGYSKFCSYTWDPTDYFGQNVKITATITSVGNSASDYVNVNVVDEEIEVEENRDFPDGKNLEIKINKPLGERVTTGRAINIIISAKGPEELGSTTLAFSGNDFNKEILISEKNCEDSYDELENTCERYYICENGKEVQYCELVETYYSEQGTGCVCRSIPEQLCNTLNHDDNLNEAGVSIPNKANTANVEDSENNTQVEDDENKQGVKTNTGNKIAPIICDGCIVEDKCVPIGYRIEDKYCDITKKLLGQLDADESCNNNFECSTNLCINDQCISGNLWQKFVNFFNNLF